MKKIFTFLLIASVNTSFAAVRWECQYFDESGEPVGGTTFANSAKLGTLAKARVEAFKKAKKDGVSAAEVQCLKSVVSDH